MWRNGVVLFGVGDIGGLKVVGKGLRSVVVRDGEGMRCFWRVELE